MQELPTNPSAATPAFSLGLGAQLPSPAKPSKPDDAADFDRNAVLAAVIEIQTELDSFQELENAAKKAANLLREATGANLVQIGWRKKPEAYCESIAFSGVTDKPNGDLFRAAAEEAIARGGTTTFPSDRAPDRAASLAVAQYANQLQSQLLLAEPLVDRRGNCLGVVFAIWMSADEAVHESAAQAKAQFAVASTPLATKLAMLQARQPRTWERAVRSLQGKAAKSKRRLIFAIILAITTALMLPAPYIIRADCEVQPVHRRMVAAPFDGPLDTVQIKPGDLVTNGQTLATMNPRELDYELAGLRAQLKQAVQEQKGMVAKHDFGASKIAKLETQRLQLEQDLLKYQRDHLEIRSPIDGMVVSGDWKQSEGTPLTKGETMFEVAPLDEMVVEISISEEDLIHVRETMRVDFYLHAIPNERITAKIEQIHPKAELRNHENVFVAKANIQDDTGILRPGMQGRASITGDRHTLGWNVFHKLMYSVRQKLGW